MFAGLVAPRRGPRAGRETSGVTAAERAQWRAQSHACAAIAYDPRTPGRGAGGIRYTIIEAKKLDPGPGARRGTEGARETRARPLTTSRA